MKVMLYFRRTVRLFLYSGLILIYGCQEQMGEKYIQNLPATEIHQLPTSTIVSSNESGYEAKLHTITPKLIEKSPDVSLTSAPENVYYPDKVNRTPSPDIVWDMIRQVNQERILTDLRRLTGVDPICIDNNCYTITNRETGSVGLQWAKNYIHDELTKMGYPVEVQNWSLEGYSDQNLIARKQGTVYPDEEIYFIAHLDGYLNHNPAADDDASGAASLLELARILRNHVLSRSVVMFFSTGEEHGALGVRNYLDQLAPDELRAIKYAITVEMLGYDSNNDGAMQLWPGDPKVYPASMAFADLLSNIINTYQLGLLPQIVPNCN